MQGQDPSYHCDE